MAAVASVLQTNPKTEKLSTGISEKSRAEMATALQGVLSATYRLLVKTQIHHWNVVGPLFYPLHVLTDDQYNDLFLAVDAIAERIRALGHPILSPAIAAPKKQVVDMPAERLIDDLVADHEALCREMSEVAKAADDIVTRDMLAQRLAFHEKAIATLKSIAVD